MIINYPNYHDKNVIRVNIILSGKSCFGATEHWEQSFTPQLNIHLQVCHDADDHDYFSFHHELIQLKHSSPYSSMSECEEEEEEDDLKRRRGVESSQETLSTTVSYDDHDNGGGNDDDHVR